MLEELRRRRVFRFSGIYIVAAWLVFQVADIFFPAWGVPDVALRYLFYAAVLCFPIALVFSWFYDVSSEGITRTRPLDEVEAVDLRLHRSDYLALAGLFLVTGAILYDSLDRVVETAEESAVVVDVPVIKEKVPHSLAVLPFDNLDEAPDTGYFSEGVSEEILTRLGGIRPLKVIGRASSFAFGGSDMGLDRISDLLGVRYLLGGSVRRSGDQVRLTARLVDDGGYQVWSRSFDGDLTQIFAFQEQIAREVASSIAELLIPSDSPSGQRGTESIEAYNLYLLARKHFYDRPPRWIKLIVDASERAIALDPEFAPAYAMLAIGLRWSRPSEEIPDPKALGRSMAEKALGLDPELAIGWFARAWLMDGQDLDQEMLALERAIELDPTLGTAYNMLYVRLNEAGRSDEAFRALERGVAVDPFNGVLLFNYASQRHLAKGDFDAWWREVSIVLELPERPAWIYQRFPEVFLSWGRIPEALHWQKQAVETYGGCQKWRCIFAFIVDYEQLGRPQEADYWLNRLALASGPENDWFEFTEVQMAAWRGQLEQTGFSQQWLQDHLIEEQWMIESPYAAKLLITAGDFSAGIRILEQQGKLIEPSDHRIDKSYFETAHLLGYAYEAAGRKDDAAAILDWSAAVVAGGADLTQPWNGHPDVRMGAALDLVARGDLSAAAAAARIAIDAGWRAYHIEKHSPIWRGAWQSPEFEPLVRDLLVDLERQREIVAAEEAEHDFHSLVESYAFKDTP